jgi:hypothetical protein
MFPEGSRVASDIYLYAGFSILSFRAVSGVSFLRR